MGDYKAIRALVAVLIQNPHHIVLFIEVRGFGNDGFIVACSIMSVYRVYGGSSGEAYTFMRGMIKIEELSSRPCRSRCRG